MAGDGRPQVDVSHLLERHECGMPIRFQRLRLSVRTGRGGEDELNHPRMWRRSADLVDEQATADVDGHPCLFGGLPDSASLHRLPGAGVAAGEDPVAAGGPAGIVGAVDQQTVVVADQDHGAPQPDRQTVVVTSQRQVRSLI